MRYAFRSLIAIHLSRPRLLMILGRFSGKVTQEADVSNGLSRATPESGPAISFTSLIPDQDHYSGRGGRAFPLAMQRRRAECQTGASGSSFRLWHRRFAGRRNGYLAPSWRIRLSWRALQTTLCARPRVPLTADRALREASNSREIWLHCYGERFADPRRAVLLARPACRRAKPHYSGGRRHSWGSGTLPEDMSRRRDTASLIGLGYVENVPKFGNTRSRAGT